jgi:hypothetical protein
MAEYIEIKMAKSLETVHDMRTERLAQLSEPQEYFLEEQAVKSKPFMVTSNNHRFSVAGK